jgi:prepilin-type N-terminal cleavage/methylation domain-containing protein
MTLIEVVVALAVVGVVAAITVPSLVVPSLEPAGVGQVVRNARVIAIARAQTVRLSVGTTGAWEVSAGSGESLASGITPGVPTIGMTFSPSGSCVLTSPLPSGWASWDAARCRAEERSR